MQNPLLEPLPVCLSTVVWARGNCLPSGSQVVRCPLRRRLDTPLYCRACRSRERRRRREGRREGGRVRERKGGRELGRKGERERRREGGREGG